MSAAHAALSDQATQAAARRPIPPTPRPRFLVPFATTITLQHRLLPSHKATVTTTTLRSESKARTPENTPRKGRSRRYGEPSKGQSDVCLRLHALLLFVRH
jgi:hypothetical protein